MDEGLFSIGDLYGPRLSLIMVLSWFWVSPAATADVDTYEYILVSNYCVGVSTFATLGTIKFSLQMLTFTSEF